MTVIEEEWYMDNGTRVKELRFYKNGNLVNIERVVCPVVPVDFMKIDIVVSEDSQ